FCYKLRFKLFYIDLRDCEMNTLWFSHSC
nr:hypothetical protein [Tanacetum cinerariifolium]